MAFTGSFKCTAGKLALIKGEVLIGHTFKLALYSNTATLDATTAAYVAGGGATGELATLNGYTLAGLTVVPSAATGTGSPLPTTMVYWDIVTDPQWTVTGGGFTCRGALLYDDTHASDVAIAVIDFGSDQVVTAGTFTIVLPDPTKETPLLAFD